MKPFIVLYATREGHTRRIAERVAATIFARGYAAEVHDVGALPASFDVYRYRGAVIAASIHGGEHEREMIEFVKRHRDALENVSAAFLSVSLSEAAAEAADGPEASREKAEGKVRDRSVVSRCHGMAAAARRARRGRRPVLTARRRRALRHEVACTSSRHVHGYVV
jgi:menaquinone-dependent protoporphyrinogen oxidase